MSKLRCHVVANRQQVFSGSFAECKAYQYRQGGSVQAWFPGDLNDDPQWIQVSTMSADRDDRVERNSFGGGDFLSGIERERNDSGFGPGNGSIFKK